MHLGRTLPQKAPTRATSSNYTSHTPLLNAVAARRYALSHSSGKDVVARSAVTHTQTITAAPSTSAATPLQQGAVNVPYYEPSNGNGNGSTVAKSDFAKFVGFFRQASPYIEGHRGRTFVVVVPGTVTSDVSMLKSVMGDVALLHGLGVNIVLVVGAQTQIDDMLRERRKLPKYISGYRITDRETLKLTVEAAGDVRTACERLLSKGPAIPMIRRHTKGDGEIHFQPALRVVSGNYITAKRRGVVDGIDFGYTGEVRFALKDDIRHQLNGNNIVLLSNLGYTASGEVLNCNTYDVGLHAAIELGADKLIYMHTDDSVGELAMPRWLPLGDAQEMLMRKLREYSDEQLDVIETSMDEDDMGNASVPMPSTRPYDFPPGQAAVIARRMLRSEQSKPNQLATDQDIWLASGLPIGLSTCVIACIKGVKRAHLLPAHIDGGLLLELYCRDGVGTMVSADFYEGIRRANPKDLDDVCALLAPLEKAGITVKRSKEEIGAMLPDFIVIERDARVLGCANLVPLGSTEDGTTVAELGAFCVSPEFRGSGRGDSMLDYVEQEARQMGIRRLVLLTTRTADWFEQRDFVWCGPASASDMLPKTRRSRIKPERNSQLYVKQLEELAVGEEKPGKRIGY